MEKRMIRQQFRHNFWGLLGEYTERVFRPDTHFGMETETSKLNRMFKHEARGGNGSDKANLFMD
jgi:hypothetical protein